MIAKIEKQKNKERFQNKIEFNPEKVKVAETLGKFGKMLAKNGMGDKSGIYGH